MVVKLRHNFWIQRHLQLALAHSTVPMFAFLLNEISNSSIKECVFRSCSRNSGSHSSLKFYLFPQKNFKNWVIQCQNELLSTNFQILPFRERNRPISAANLYFKAEDYTENKLKKSAVPKDLQVCKVSLNLIFVELDDPIYIC